MWKNREKPSDRWHVDSASSLCQRCTALRGGGLEFERLTPPSRLYGANGLRTGRDNRLYVAQVVGSQISAVDVATGACETISPLGGAIIGPDDLAFDDRDNLYVTEFTEGLISVRVANGRTRVLRDDVQAPIRLPAIKGAFLLASCDLADESWR
jgi:sugar lactone lactonase YvrE